jgi:hypothetical protein
MEQDLRAIQVGQDQFQEPRPLHEAGGLESVRVLRRDQQRDRVQNPRSAQTAGVAVDVVGHPVVVDQLPGVFPPARDFGEAQFVQGLEERPPMWAQTPFRVDHLVAKLGRTVVEAAERAGLRSVQLDERCGHAFSSSGTDSPGGHSTITGGGKPMCPDITALPAGKG